MRLNPRVFPLLAVWELYTCNRVYSTLTQGQVYVGVAQYNLRPEIPADCPENYVGIMTACWDADPQKRWVHTDCL